jgi:hypothetical protein
VGYKTFVEEIKNPIPKTHIWVKTQMAKEKPSWPSRPYKSLFPPSIWRHNRKTNLGIAPVGSEVVLGCAVVMWLEGICGTMG